MIRWFKKLFGQSAKSDERPREAASRPSKKVAGGAERSRVSSRIPSDRPSGAEVAPGPPSEPTQGELFSTGPRQRGLFEPRPGGAGGSGEVVEVSIGLDFGTHSTKVVVRKEIDEHGELLVLAPPPDNDQVFHPHADAPFPWFGLPSVVGIRDGHLVFGEEARCLEESHRHFALKATLTKGVPHLPSEMVKAIGSTGEREAVDELCVAYLGWVLQKIHHRLDERIGRGRWQPLVAVGAPMDRFEDAELKSRYERILNAAFKGVMSAEEPRLTESWQLEDSLETIRALLDSSLPDAGERRFKVLPETVAAMVPLSFDPRWRGGLFNVVDIGGGTTELSIVHLVTDPSPVIDCRGDRSVPVGGIALRECEAEQLDEDPLDLIMADLRRVWCGAHDLDWPDHRLRSPWKKNSILRAGGGWRRRVQEMLVEWHPSRSYYGPPNNLDADFQLSCVLYEPSREVLRAADGESDSIQSSREGFQLLPVALGLSFFPGWPDWFKPSEAVAAKPDERDVLHTDPFHGHS